MSLTALCLVIYYYVFPSFIGCMERSLDPENLCLSLMMEIRR